MNKFVRILKKIFGAVMLVSLFAGGLSFLGYVAALCIGGETATAVCAFIFKKYFPWVIRFTSIGALLGLISMYLEGQLALTVKAKKENK